MKIQHCAFDNLVFQVEANNTQAPPNHFTDEEMMLEVTSGVLIVVVIWTLYFIFLMYLHCK